MTEDRQPLEVTFTLPADSEGWGALAAKLAEVVKDHPDLADVSLANIRVRPHLRRTEEGKIVPVIGYIREGTMFHATDPKYRESIRRYGLDFRKGESHLGESEGAEPGNYLYEGDPDLPTADLWEVRTEGLDVRRDPYDDPNAEQPRSVYVPDPIPPDRLALVRPAASTRPRAKAPPPDPASGDEPTRPMRFAGPQAVEYAATWEELPDVVYHVAPARLHDAIVREGLQPQGHAWNFALSEMNRSEGGHWDPETQTYVGAGSDDYGWRPEAAYVFADPNEAVSFQEEYARRHGEPMEVFAVDALSILRLPPDQQPQVIKDPEQIQQARIEEREMAEYGGEGEGEPATPEDIFEQLENGEDPDTGDPMDLRQWAIVQVPPEFVRPVRPYEIKDQEDWNDEDVDDYYADHPEEVEDEEESGDEPVPKPVADTVDALLEGLPLKRDPNLPNEARSEEYAAKPYIALGPKFYNLTLDQQRHVLLHEAAHFYGLDDAFLKDPNADWDLAAKTPSGHLNGETTPGEIIAEAYATLWESPEWLDSHAAPIREIVERLARERGLPIPGAA